MSPDDSRFLAIALEEARAAAAVGDVPVGAVVAKDGAVLSRARNRREADQDPTAHAEVLALREAARAIGDWNLSGTTLYITLEPCPMCAGAMMLARVAEVVYAAADPKGGAVSLGIDILGNRKLNHRVTFRHEAMPEASELLTSFFRTLRSKGAP